MTNKYLVKRPFYTKIIFKMIHNKWKTHTYTSEMAFGPGKNNQPIGG